MPNCFSVELGAALKKMSLSQSWRPWALDGALGDTLICPCAQCLSLSSTLCTAIKGLPSRKLGKQELGSARSSPGGSQPGYRAPEQSSLCGVEEDSKITFSSSRYPAPPLASTLTCSLLPYTPLGSPRIPLKTFTSSSPI